MGEVDSANEASKTDEASSHKGQYLMFQIKLLFCFSRVLFFLATIFREDNAALENNA